jgi:hypothetical protein
MALTVSAGNNGRSNDAWGARAVTLLTVTFDSDYLEGGEAFSPALYHNGKVDHVRVSARAHARGVNVAYDATAGTLVAFGKADGTRTYDQLCHCDLSDLVVDVTIVSD